MRPSWLCPTPDSRSTARRCDAFVGRTPNGLGKVLVGLLAADVEALDESDVDRLEYLEVAGHQSDERRSGKGRGTGTRRTAPAG